MISFCCEFSKIVISAYCMYRYCGSLATGLVFHLEKTTQLLEGSCQEFFNLKSTIKCHITLAGGHLRFEALQVNVSFKIKIRTISSISAIDVLLNFFLFHTHFNYFLIYIRQVNVFYSMNKTRKKERLESDSISGTQGDVSGAKAKELAKGLYGKIQNAYPIPFKRSDKWIVSRYGL